MLKMCICDDKEADVKELQRLAHLFTKEHPGIPIQVKSFSSTYGLLEYIEEFGGFDLYLLEIIMPYLDGLAVAKKIRQRGEAAEILFMTISREFAVEAFSVKASNYLLKPIRKENFDREVLSCIQTLAPKENPAFLLKTKGGVRKVGLREIVMIESFNHSRACTLVDGTTFETSTTLSALFGKLGEYACFYMPHRSYIVHLDYVNGLTPSELTLSNGKRIPVSRKTYTDLKMVLSDYAIENI